MKTKQILQCLGLLYVSLFLHAQLVHSNDSNSEARPPADGLYSFLESLKDEGGSETAEPKLDYLFRSPDCFKGRRKDLQRKFGETLSNNGYVNTAWELTLTSYVSEKPQSWPPESYAQFHSLFGTDGGVRGILVVLRDDGSIGYGQKGLTYEPSNTWSYDKTQIELHFAEFDLKMNFPLPQYGRPNYLMLKDSNRSPAVTVMLRALDSYKNIYYAVPEGSSLSDNIEAAMERESSQPSLECWKGGPEHLDAIPDNYWFREHSR